MTLLPYLIPARRALVVVPTKLLRGQVGAEFTSLATLRRTGACPADMPGPRVCQVSGILDDISKWEALADYDVIIGTPNCLSPGHEAVTNPPDGLFDLLIVDEAHHFPAETWSVLAAANPEARVALFTATPFRRDRKEITAKPVFVYPLRQALADGILSPVTFVPVNVEPGDDIDAALAAATAERLRSAEHAGNGSRAIIRTDTIEHAGSLVDVYAAAGVRTERITGASAETTVRRAIAKLRDGSLDGLINVGVLGEGFDFPELKIGVYHRRHKSLPATLQFLGRISRISKASAPAELLAVREEVQDETRELYASDSSWAELLPGLMDAAVAEEHERREFLAEFGHLPSGPISLAALMPRKHFQVFRMTAPIWLSAKLAAAVETINGRLVVYDAADSSGLTKVAITQQIVRPDWIDSAALDAPHFDLFLAFAFPDYELVFVRAPDDRSAEALVATIGLTGAEPVEPEWLDQMMSAQRLISYFSLGMRSVQPGGRRLATYRSMAGQSVGTAVQASESRLYASGHAIARIADPLAPDPGSARTTSLGVSHGRSTIFSPDHAPLLDLRHWCQKLAELAASISDDPLGLPGLPLRSMRRIERFPEHPYAAVLDQHLLWQGLYILQADGSAAPLDAIEVIVARLEDDRLRIDFDLGGAHLWAGELEIHGYIKPLTDDCPVFRVGATEQIGSVSKLLGDCPITVFYGDASASRGRMLLRASTDYPDLDKETLQNWELGNVDKSAESKAPAPGKITVHDWAIGKLRTGDPDQWIIKDDGAGELADILVVEQQHSDPAQLTVTFVHCKWSGGDTANPRLADLYELMGQAVRTVRWTGSGVIWAELTRRLATRASTKVVAGDQQQITAAVAQYAAAPPGVTFKVICVQPGLNIDRVNSWASGKSLICATNEWLTVNDIELTLVGGK